MIGQGWTHGDLNAMNEEEFAWWYEEAVALEEAKAEAIRNAQSK